MEITCENCQSKFKIADEKIPQGKTATVQCPKCKETITIQAAETINPETNDEAGGVAAEFGFEEDGYESSEKPFDFIEEEGQVALVCESDAVIRDTIVRALEVLEYHVSVAADSREALRNLRYKVYDMIVFD